jgi:hypothetical protein
MNVACLKRIAVAAAGAAAIVMGADGHARACTMECSTVTGYVPGAKYGDIVFNNYNASTAGTIGQVLHQIGLQRVHSGMMLDASNVAHDSMSAKSIMDHLDVEETCVGINITGNYCNGTNVPNFCFYGVNTGRLHIDSSLLYGAYDTYVDANGNTQVASGAHVANLADEADPDGGNEWHDVTIMTTKDEGASRTRAEKAANYLGSWAEYTPGWLGYSLYAYTSTANTWGASPTSSSCSGAIYEAFQSSEGPGSPFSLVSFNAEQRETWGQDAYPVLVSGLYDKVFPMIAAAGGDGCGLTTDSSPWSMSWSASNIFAAQIMDTMAFNQPYNYGVDGTTNGPCSQAWAEDEDTDTSFCPAAALTNPGAGSAIRPDDLVTQSETCTLVPTGTWTYTMSCVPAATSPYTGVDNTVVPQPTHTTCFCGGGAK